MTNAKAMRKAALEIALLKAVQENDARKVSFYIRRGAGNLEEAKLMAQKLKSSPEVRGAIEDSIDKTI